MRTCPALVFACSLLVLSVGGVAAQDSVRPLAGDDPVIGEPFPEAQLLDTEGHTVRLSSLRGSTVVLTFGSCYADRCASILGGLDTLLADFPQEHVSLLYVCCEMPPSLSRDGFVSLKNRCGPNRRYLLDTDHQVKARLRVHQLPTTFLINREGVTLARVRGVTDLNGWEFRALLAKEVTTGP